MSAPHDPECEKAEPGSLCDCDCAGARHAVRRTAGNVAAAGAVSRRARRIAEKDGRAPVVNRLVPPEDGPDAGKHRRAGRHREDVHPQPLKIPRTPAVLSAATKARLARVRKSLPKSRDEWDAVAREPRSPEQMDKFRRQNAQLQDDAAKARAELDGYVEKVAREYVIPKQLLTEKRPGYKQYKKNDPDLLPDALLFANHRVYDVPELAAERERLETAAWQAESKAALGARALAEHEKGRYPIVELGGDRRLRMPTRKLARHLKAVRDAGRAVLAEARTAWEDNPPPAVTAAHDLIRRRADTRAAVQMLRSGMLANLSRGAFNAYDLPDEGDLVLTDKDRIKALHGKYTARLEALDAQAPDAQHTIAAHQYSVLREMLGEHRPFGGRGHDNVIAERDDQDDKIVDAAKRRGAVAPRADWRQRLTTAEQHFPADWLAASGSKPLKVGASKRAYYGGGLSGNLLSMPSHDYDGQQVGGALDYIDEVNVHELGHRMEATIPGLTHLEFAYVRERGVDAKGAPVFPKSIAGYADADEVSQEDDWADPYTGKTYELGAGYETPGDQAWEVFQVGLQETYGRGSRMFGPKDDPDGLQAFTIGALLTLG